jgi:hypothetical protein
VGELTEFNREFVTGQEKDMVKRLQQLHDEGVIDLDAPLRELGAVAAKNVKKRNGGKGGEEAGYWFVGSKSWFHH